MRCTEPQHILPAGEEISVAWEQRCDMMKATAQVYHSFDCRSANLRTPCLGNHNVEWGSCLHRPRGCFQAYSFLQHLIGRITGSAREWEQKNVESVSRSSSMEGFENTHAAWSFLNCRYGLVYKTWQVCCHWKKARGWGLAKHWRVT